MAAPALLGTLLRALGSRVAARTAAQMGPRAAAREGGGLLDDLLKGLFGRTGQRTAEQAGVGAAEAATSKSSEVVREVVREAGIEAAERASASGPESGAAGGEQGSAVGGPQAGPAGGEAGSVPQEQPNFADILKQPGAFGDILAAGASGNSQDKIFEIQQKLRADRESLRLQQDQNIEQERTTDQLKTFGATLAGIAGASVPLVLGLDKLGANALASQERLGEFNGVIAGAMAQLEVDRINRSLQFGREVQGSAAALARAQSRLEESLLPAQSFMQNVYNSALAAVNDVVAMGVQQGTETVEDARTGFTSGDSAIGRAFNETVDAITGFNRDRIRELMAEKKKKDELPGDEPAMWRVIREYADKDEPVYDKKLKRKRSKR